MYHIDSLLIRLLRMGKSAEIQFVRHSNHIQEKAQET
jgi:hypothetical protein